MTINKLSSSSLYKTVTTASPTVKGVYTAAPKPASSATVSIAPTTSVVKTVIQAEAEKAAAAAQNSGTVSLTPTRPAMTPTPSQTVPMYASPARPPTNSDSISIPGLGSTPNTQPVPNGTGSGGGGGGGGGYYQPEENPAYESPYPSEADSLPNYLQYSESGTAWNNDAAVPIPNSGIVVSPPSAKTSVANTPGPEVKATLWERILGFFGLAKKTSVQVHGELDSLSEAAESVVRRARAGDQVAVAIINIARENANKGDAKAKKALKAILAYCDKNPVSDTMHGEMTMCIKHEDMQVCVRHDPCVDSAVRLSQGPLLSNPRIGNMVDSCSFSGEERKAMLHGFHNPRTVPHRKVSTDFKLAHATGRVLGMAKRLQAVRMPNSSISAFDPVVGWEFGE